MHERVMFAPIVEPAFITAWARVSPNPAPRLHRRALDFASIPCEESA